MAVVVDFLADVWDETWDCGKEISAGMLPAVRWLGQQETSGSIGGTDGSGAPAGVSTGSTRGSSAPDVNTGAIDGGAPAGVNTAGSDASGAPTVSILAAVMVVVCLLMTVAAMKLVEARERMQAG